MDQKNFKVSEADAIARLGVTYSWLRSQREHLVEGLHYISSGRRLVLSEDGLNVIAKRFTPDAQAAAHLLPPPPALIDLVVVNCGKTRSKNKHLVEAVSKDMWGLVMQPLLRVNVRDNATYWTGQEIKGREVSAGLFDHWDPVKNCQARPPTRRGKA